MSVAGKPALMDWVEDQTEIDPLSKYILEKMAAFADAEACGYAVVSLIAKKVNTSERTVQRRLRDLEELRLIENTGRTHRLRDSTRSVPIYQIAPDVEGFGRSHSMGDNAVTHRNGPWVTKSVGMGDTVVTRIDTKESNGESYDSPACARARERAAFEDLEKAYPKAGLKITDREAAWIAICALADMGVEIETLAACAAAMATDPLTKKRDFLPSMQAWMTRGQYRGYWPDDPVSEVVAVAPIVAGDGVPADVVEGLGAAFLAAWAPGATWRAADRTLVVRLGLQASKFRNDKRADLQRLGVRVVGASEADLVGADR